MLQASCWMARDRSNYRSRSLCSSWQSEAIDLAIDHNFQEEQASRSLQIGLLCVQASIDLRPESQMWLKCFLTVTAFRKPMQPPPLYPTSLTESSVSVRPPSCGSEPKSSSQSSESSMTESFTEPK